MRHNSERRTRLLHLNPAYDDCDYAPQALGPTVPTLGIRNAEDIPSILGFAQFVDANGDLAVLQRHLETLATALIETNRERP